MDRPLNRLYPMETSFQFFLKDDRPGSAQKDETNTRPKGNAAGLIKSPIKYASGIN